MSGDKSLGYLLRHGRGSYELAGEEFNKPPVPNPSLYRLTSPKVVTDKMSVSIPLSDLKKIESLLIATQESQSFSMWLFGGLLNYIKSSGYHPPEIAMFERLCSSITGAQVRSNSFLQKLQAFMTLSRRKLYLSHAPPSIVEEQRSKLLASPVFSEFLFDQNTLDQVLAEHKEDVSTSTNQTLAKTMSSVLPSLVGKKRKLDDSASSLGMASAGSPLSVPKASTCGTSAPIVGGLQSHNRGRGRGGRGGVSGGRRRGDSKGSRNPKKDFQN